MTASGARRLQNLDQLLVSGVASQVGEILVVKNPGRADPSRLDNVRKVPDCVVDLTERCEIAGNVVLNDRIVGINLDCPV